MLPAILPLFPLPQVLVFPNTYQPLHIFEPRYRKMTAEILATHRHLVMVLAREGRSLDTLEEPEPDATYEIGCLAKVVRAEPLQDGRWNLLIEGRRAVHLEREVPGKPYRQAKIKTSPFDGDTPCEPVQRARFIQSLKRYATRHGIESQLKELLDLSLDDASLLFTLGVALDFEPVEKQFLLEAPSIPVLAERLLQLIEFSLSDRTFHGFRI